MMNIGEAGSKNVLRLGSRRDKRWLSIMLAAPMIAALNIAAVAQSIVYRTNMLSG
jgi:hypothetical protein